MTSYPPPYPPSTPPPPPLGAFERQEVKTPPVAWLVPVAAVLAVVGAFLPWFHGHADVPGRGSTSFEESLYSFKDGRIGLLPPIALVVLSISVISLLRGTTPRRFARGSSGPVVSAAKGALIIGALSLVCVTVAWFLVPSQYKFTESNGEKLSWNDALDRLHAAGVQVSFARGPQLGYFLTIAAGVLAMVAGVLMLVTRSKTLPLAAGAGYGLQPAWGQPPAYGAPQTYSPPHGYPPPAWRPPAGERTEGRPDPAT